MILKAQSFGTSNCCDLGVCRVCKYCFYSDGIYR